jgi:hypothetical protein
MSRPTGFKSVLIAAAVFSILSVTAAITSDGFLDADAATHYLFARYALHNPFYLVNVWGRPLATAVYMPGVFLAGRLGARLMSLLCALTCATLAWRLAILQRHRLPALAAIFTLGQPLFFLHSFSEMTELPFAATLALAFLAYRTRRWGWLAFFASLLPLGRPEGFAFCLLAAAALILHRRYLWILLTPLATIAWCYSGWLIEGRHGDWWQWLAHAWPYGSGSDYARGAPLHFVYLLPMLVSPAALPAIWIGIVRSLRCIPRISPSPGTPGEGRGEGLRFDHGATARQKYPSPYPSPGVPGEGREGTRAHRRLSQFLIAAIPLTVLIFHSLFHALGKFSSNGELRYLLIVAPFWGLLAATGWEWAFSRLRFRHATAWAGASVTLPFLLNLFVPIVPLHMDARWQSAHSLVDWYKHSSIRRPYPYLLFADPAIDYFLDTNAEDSTRSTPWNKELVADKPSGTLLIWDDGFSNMNSNADRDVTLDEIRAAGWVMLPNPPGIAPSWRLFISPWPLPNELR